MLCPFCSEAAPYLESNLAYAKYDLYPVSEGHTLVITKRHISGYFETTEEERLELWQLIDRAKAELHKKFSPDAFNIGINDGEAAGQTVPHLHIHLIPRYSGDVSDPAGGVRGVIPDKQRYIPL
jgi:diadenosine tetraphosphate (Ap4A) HIT family hydrolase